MNQIAPPPPKLHIVKIHNNEQRATMKHRIEPKLKKKNQIFPTTRWPLQHCNRLPATNYTHGATITIIQQPLTSCVRRRRRTDAIRRSLAITLPLAPSPTKTSFTYINRGRTRRRRRNEEQKMVVIVKEMMERDWEIGLLRPWFRVYGRERTVLIRGFVGGRRRSVSLPLALFLFLINFGFAYR